MENNFTEKEKEILKFWEENKIFEKLKKKNKGARRWSFLDGPITANNPMGVHHAWGRTLKDMFQRFKAMQGYDQRFQNGFDCQGLWLEVEVEKEMGFKNKKDIETYGIEKFVNKCKERAHKYSKIQTQQSIRLGMMCDWGNWQTDFDEKGEWIKQSHSYYTLSDENNYAIWHFLKKCHEKKYLYKGRDVVPWCPRCGTAISQHEILTEEYKEITHKAVYFRLPVIGEPNTYFLAWTTTPWTLPANVFLSVHPDLIYAKVKDAQGNIYILLKEKANLIEEGKIIEEFEGKNLEGWRYIGPFDDLGVVRVYLSGFDIKNKDLEHSVFLWQEVTTEEGTGIVHSAPGCGKEDFELSKEYGLPYINPMDPNDNESRYDEKQDFGFLSGMSVYAEKTRDVIFENLKDKEINGQRYNFVYKIEDYKHRYPICWRCKTELIFRLVDEWYIAMGKLREPLIKSVEKINWTPSFCKEREIDWLRNMHDWLISKKRYWGLALPIWECGCSHFEVFGSLEELKQKAVEGLDKFDGHSPHRPWIDEVKIKCPKCGKIISRIADVGNVWLDAGIVPFSTISDDNRSENIPYFHDNRKEWQKWFPVELVCEGFPGQFKNWFYVLLVMSQVLENEPPFKNLLGFANVVDEKGEEMHKSKGNAIWFDEGVEKIGADVMRWIYLTQNPANNMRFGYNVAKETHRKLLTLWNCFTFYKTYASQNSKFKIQKPKTKNLLDLWVLSRIHGLIQEVTKSLDNFNAMKASQAIENFWINDLSLWYVRRSRKRFQNPESEIDKETAEQTLRYVLITLCKLIGPMVPFMAETIYQGLKKDDDPESVHLCEYPEAEKKAIDETLEKDMAQVREIVSLALAKRAELGIGVRQPLSKLRVQNSKFKITSQNSKISDLIVDEVNVKEVTFEAKLKEEIELDTRMTEELKEAGQIREIIRQIQDLRKKAGLVPADRIVINYAGDESIVKVLLKNQKNILEITKADSLQANKEKTSQFLAEKELQIDGQAIWLAIVKF